MPPGKQLALAMLSYCEQRNLSARRICEAAQLTFNDLLNVDGREPTHGELNELWKQAIAVSLDPLFGLHFGESLQLAALGIIGEIIKTSPTVGAAITTAATLVPHLTDRVAINVDHKNEHSAISINPVRANLFDEISRHIADFVLVFTVHELNGLVIRKVKPLKATVSGAKTYFDEYMRVLRCEPDFGSSYELRFDAILAKTPVVTADYQRQQHLYMLLSTLSKSTPGTYGSFEPCIRRYLLDNAFLGIATLEDVAANFNITSRSLQRRLKKEGTSYQRIANEVRRSIAVEFVKEGNYQVKEISALLGYNEVSAFSRAFKRWTGRAPVAFH